MQHAIVVFRIKWVWIWLRLSDTRVSSRGAFFGRIDDPRFKKKKISHIGELPKDQLQMTADSTYMVEVGVPRSGPARATRL